MAKGLSRKKLEQLFAAYVERQSIRNVAKVCNVSHTTVRKYRDKLGWDQRLKDVQAKAVEKGNNTLADSIAKNLEYVQFVKGKIMENIMVKGVGGTNPVNDLDKAIRLELLLRGEADSKTEVVSAELKAMSTEELLEMRKNLKG